MAPPHELDADNFPAIQEIQALGPMAARALLFARDTSNTPPPRSNAYSGVVDPADINNRAIFALFGLIGASLVLVAIWFFFWAQNGGFEFGENDWEDYKSTVLRRIGPNGTVLSSATKTTKLGGGSVYKDVDEGDGMHQRGGGWFGRSKKKKNWRHEEDDRYTSYDDDGHTAYDSYSYGSYGDDDAATTVSGLTGITGITPGPSDIGGRERHMRRKEMRERKKLEKAIRKQEEKLRKQSEKSGKTGDSHVNAAKPGRHVGDHGVIDEEAEKEAKELLKKYRHERPARVGGLNAESDSSTQWGGSSISGVSASLLDNRQATPTKPTSAAAGGTSTVFTSSTNTTSTTPSRPAPAPAPTTTTSSTGYSYSYSGNKFSLDSSGPDKPLRPMTTAIVPAVAPTPPAAIATPPGGIRKVYSTADKTRPGATTTDHQERIRAEARRLAEKGRAARTVMSGASSSSPSATSSSPTKPSAARSSRSPTKTTAVAAAAGSSSPTKRLSTAEQLSPRRDFSFQRGTTVKRGSSRYVPLPAPAGVGGEVVSPVIEETMSMLSADERGSANHGLRGGGGSSLGGSALGSAIGAGSAYRDVRGVNNHGHDKDDDDDDDDDDDKSTVVGTKAYHHPIPELAARVGGSGSARQSASTNARDYVDDRRKARRAAAGTSSAVSPSRERRR